MKETTNNFIIDGNGVLLSYKGHDSHVIIPEGVIELEAFCLSDRDYIEELTLPSTLREFNVGAVLEDNNIQNVYVENNPYLKSSEGMLFSSDYKTLLYCPPANAKDKPVVVLPDSVTTIANAACFYAKFNKLVLPKGLCLIKHSAFTFGVIKDINLDECENLKLEEDAFNSTTLPEIVNLRVSNIPKTCFMHSDNVKCINILSPCRIDVTALSASYDLCRVYVHHDCEMYEDANATRCYGSFPIKSDDIDEVKDFIIGVADEGRTYNYCKERNIPCRIIPKDQVDSFFSEVL